MYLSNAENGTLAGYAMVNSSDESREHTESETPNHVIVDSDGEQYEWDSSDDEGTRYRRRSTVPIQHMYDVYDELSDDVSNPSDDEVDFYSGVMVVREDTDYETINPATVSSGDDGYYNYAGHSIDDGYYASIMTINDTSDYVDMKGKSSSLTSHTPANQHGNTAATKENTQSETPNHVIVDSDDERYEWDSSDDGNDGYNRVLRVFLQYTDGEDTDSEIINPSSSRDDGYNNHASIVTINNKSDDGDYVDIQGKSSAPTSHTPADQHDNPAAPQENTQSETTIPAIVDSSGEQYEWDSTSSEDEDSPYARRSIQIYEELDEDYDDTD